ncbi:mannose-6-phosphate isomerase, class I [Photobacterium rosenbergii]|nr:mannose-6-phosphate isomerase, class I [Photobacterium rosenbergii]
MDNTIQDYEWGSKEAIGYLFGLSNPNNKPMAEIWMGAHPKASSAIMVEGQQLSLNAYINAHKEEVVGRQTYQRFGELPYLFKVLSAGKALSIQAHPSKSQAEAGFARENEQGIPVAAAHRQYKDSNHKPEIIYALTPFLAMNGFRAHHDILNLLSALQSPLLDVPLQSFASAQDGRGLRQLFETVLSFDGEPKQALLASLISWAHREQSPLAQLVIMLSGQYPGDIGLLAPLMLNVVELEPGEAMFLDAGTPHAYIQGTGLEVMANSDNVLRAGLTPKHIDVGELLACCRFEALQDDKLLIQPQQQGVETLYPVPVDDFCFSILDKPDGHLIDCESCEIWFAIDDNVAFSDSSGGELIILKGQSVFVSAKGKGVLVTSEGKVARVSSPL